MRRGGGLLLAIVCALIAAPAAGAGFAVQLRADSKVVDVGDVVKIELRAFVLKGATRRLDDLTNRRLRIEAVSPEHLVVRIWLRHVTRRVWRGSSRLRGVRARAPPRPHDPPP